MPFGIKYDSYKLFKKLIKYEVTCCYNLVTKLPKGSPFMPTAKQATSFIVSLSLLVINSFAGIISDPAAAKSNQPAILKAPNEATVVNITIPNNKGISFNEYKQFNTTNSGTVLNNSANGANTQIAGFVNANPFLNGGSASLIINQVNSNSPSLLKGNLEIAGARADLLIANPSGISINGLNVINANSSSFAASKVILNNDGSLKELNLNPYLNGGMQSKIEIVGNGLNDKNSNYTNIIANTISVASNIHSGELNLISANGKVLTSGSGKFSVPLSANINSATSSTNAISIDSTNLGGMYANKISIIATSDGVGVNNAGIIKANNIRINAHGDILNGGIIKADSDINLISNNSISNKDKASIISGSNVNISSGKAINNIDGSSIVSANNLKLNAKEINNASSDILASSIDIEANKLNNYSLNNLETNKENFSGNIDLGCCGERAFKLSSDIKKIKDEIKAKWKLEAKSYTDDELEAELFDKVVSDDVTAYALNLHKNSYLHGTSSYPYVSLRLDESSNSIIITTSHVKNYEKTRKLYYNIDKEYITDESRAKFIPSNIYANSNININADTITNDKSRIYAGNDIKANAKELNNIGFDLNRDVSSHLRYEWKQEEWKGKIGKITGKKHWVTKGGDSAYISKNYKENGYPAVFASNNNFYASLTNLNNGNIDDLANKTIDIPLFKPSKISPISFYPTNTGFLYSINGGSMAYTIGRFDTFYKDINSLIQASFERNKGYNQRPSSLILAKNKISIDASGNIYNSAALIASSINLNANSITNKDALLISSGDTNINADTKLAISSSTIVSDIINLNANDISIDQTSSEYKNSHQEGNTLGASSNLEAGSDISLKSNNIFISGASLKAGGDINLNANNNIDIKASKEEYVFDLKGKDTAFKGGVVYNTGSKLKANNINANAKDINLIAANLDASSDININAQDNINIQSINDRTDLEATTTTKGFLSKKQTNAKNIKEGVIYSNLRAANINLVSKEDTAISGSNLLANDIKIDANNININPVAYESLEYSQTNKKGFGGFKRSLDIHSLAKLSLAGSSLTTTSGNISLNANNDISIVSSNVNSASNLNLSAPNTISIIAAKEQSKEISIHKSSKFNPLGTLAHSGAVGTGSGEIYTVNYNEQGSLDGLSKLSNISAKDNINLNTSDATITANLSSDKNIDIKANSTSILNATNTHENYSISNSKSISISKLQDILKESKPKSISELKKDTSVKLRVADAKYKKATNNASSLKSISSTLNAENINIKTNEDISITGSDLNAKEDISIISKNGNIYISNSTDTLDTASALKQAEAALSLTIQNEYAQVAPAAIALAEAIKQLKNVKKEYDEYKKQKSNLSSKLSEIKQRYKNKEVGIDASDIEDLTDILDNIKDEEKYYIANIALATTNVASKTTALVSQAAAAASSSVTYGFSAGVAADLSGTQTNSKTKQTVSTPSNLIASNIRLETNKDKDTSTNITGSNLLASNNIDINTKDLNINSSQDTFELDEKSKAISGSVKFTMYGGGGGSLGLNYSQSNSDRESIANNNSRLISNKDININTSNDATVKGANLRADGTLNLKVGNNLVLESVRDKYTSSQKGFSISGGIGLGGNTKAESNGIKTTGLFDKNHFVDTSSVKTSSSNANFSQQRSNAITKQTILSSITANNLNVEVGNNTHLKGSLLAAGEYDKDNTFIDNHNLNLKTNTLSYENLSNTSYTKGTNFSIGANYSLGKKDQANQNSQGKSDSSYSGLKSINYSNQRNLSYTLSKNLATLGSGNIEIADKENSDDLDRLNKDTTKLTKDLVNTSVSSNVDASIDARVFSKEGRKEIAKEIVDSGTIIDAINQIATTDRATILSFFKEVSKQYSVLNGVREEVANSLELQAFLSSSTTTDTQRKEAMALVTLAVMKNLGYLPNDIKAIYTDQTGYNGEKIKGFTSLQNGASYINFKNITDMKDLVKTITHENQRSMDIQDHRDINQNREDNTKYASNFSDFTTRYFSHALWLNDKGFSKTPLTTAVTSSMINNNKEFAKLDKNLGVNRPLHNDEKQWIDKNVDNFKDFYKDQTGISLNNLQVKKLLYHSANSMVDADENIGFIGKIFGKPQFDKNDEALANKFIIENSQGLKFENYYDGDELLRRQDYFTATKKQFYKGEDFNQNTPGALIDMSGMFLGAGGSGFIANAGTKGLSKLILNQEAKTSVKAGLVGATIDASWQLGTQIYDQVINNNGYVDLSRIDLNYNSIVFNGIASAVTIPKFIDSYKTVKYSYNAQKTLNNQLKTTVSPQKIQKIKDNIKKHNTIMYQHGIFQGLNYGNKKVIEGIFVEKENKNE